MLFLLTSHRQKKVMPAKEAVIFLIISCQVRFRITPSPPKHIDNFTITLMVIVGTLVGEQIFGICVRTQSRHV
jgi:hypothetical protein